MNKIRFSFLLLLNVSLYSQVGINTTNPQADLDVNGTVFTRQTLGVAGQLYFNSTPTLFPDVLLKKAGVNVLQTEAFFILKNNNLTSSSNFQSYDALSDLHPTFAINKEGTIVLGNGSIPGDVRISRGGPNLLRLQNASLAISKSGNSDITPALRFSKDELNSLTNPYPEFEMYVNGKLRWGDGVNIPDLNLERDISSAKLKLTGSAYSGAPGVRYLLIDPVTGLISMSTITTTLKSNSTLKEVENQEKLEEKIKKLESIVLELERKLSLLQNKK